MPTYTLRNKETNEVFDVIVSYSTYEKMLEENSNLERVWDASALIVGGVTIGRSMKPDDGFRDVLRKIKNENRGSNINTF